MRRVTGGTVAGEPVPAGEVEDSQGSEQIGDDERDDHQERHEEEQENVDELNASFGGLRRARLRSMHI